MGAGSVGTLARHLFPDRKATEQKEQDLFGPKDSDSWWRWWGQEAGNILPSFMVPEGRFAKTGERVLKQTFGKGRPGIALGKLVERAQKLPSWWHGDTAAEAAKRVAAAQTKMFRGVAGKGSSTLERAGRGAGRVAAGTAGGAMIPGNKDATRGQNAVAGAAGSAVLGPAFKALGGLPYWLRVAAGASPYATAWYLHHALGTDLLPVLGIYAAGDATARGASALAKKAPAATQGALTAQAVPKVEHFPQTLQSGARSLDDLARALAAQQSSE